MRLFGTTLALTLLAGGAAYEHVTITVEGDQRCIISDGVPAHETGPWREGATVEPQSHRFCMDATPELTDTITDRVRISGVTVTGIPLRPGTAEYYDGSTERGYSRDPSSGWNVEGIGGLIMDEQNAHVDGDGMYHYHGIPSAVVGALNGTLFGYAADGFEIHYMGDQVQSSWQLKPGERESGPGGLHDGTYVQDYEFVEGSGMLDECNGGMLDGQYVYFATDTYPFFPRCFRGTVSSDFMNGGGDRPPQGERPPRGDGERPPRGERPPIDDGG
ncbi:YHYH protein [Gymnodinialimonas sp. 2305UL16-5]|uniref:YHYH protein n=1 Tax=Gymnodinialimonas mytili TaxID=3126503 RepID=UPI00309EAFF6